MDTEVEFTSELFLPILPEESQVNPECYGAELAWWLCRELMSKGVVTTYPNLEDWGWFIEYFVEDNEYWLCCGNVDGGKTRWLIYLKAHAKSMFGRNPASVKGAAPLLGALRGILDESDEVTDVQWRSA